MRKDGVIGKIEEQEWLKPAEEGLQKAIHKAFQFKGGRQAKNFLHGTWIGHPLHVILTDVPIGAWTTVNARRRLKDCVLEVSQMLGWRSKYSSSSFFPPSPAPKCFSDLTNSMRSIQVIRAGTETRSRFSQPLSRHEPFSVQGAQAASSASAR